MWILILTITVAHGASITTAEFNNQKSCEIAGKTWQADVKKPFNSATWHCMKKD